MSALAQQLIAENKRTKAKSLDLGNCGLTDLEKEVPELFELTHLEELYLCNRYWDVEQQEWIKSTNKGYRNWLSVIPPSIRQLSNLNTLYIGGSSFSNQWRIKRINSLTTLSKLQKLYLGYTTLQEVSPLQKCTELHTLYFLHNAISDGVFLENLSKLHTLYLADNLISDYSFLENITGLHTLYFHDYATSDYSFLENLTQLKNLDIDNSIIEDLSFLEKLTQLNTLKIKSHVITKRGYFLKNLTQLRTLIFPFSISDTSFLKNLTQLRNLDLSSSQISDIYFLKNLTQLKILNLSDNKISDIHSLKNLTQLNTLDLSKNKISDIRFLSKLTQLNTLDFRCNQVTDLSPILPLIQQGVPVIWYFKKYAMYGIYVGDNPLTTPPIEIVKQGNKAILRYFEELERSGLDYLYEAKVLLVGEGNVGKTTLRRKLENADADMPPTYARTPGIDISRIPFQHLDERNFFLNVWDFGGQDIYHNTHHFFLTKRSLYVLVTNTRSQEDNFDYWIPNIRLFGGKSPILIVKNKWQDAVKGSSIDRKISITRFRQNEAFNIPENLLEVNLYTKEKLDSLSKTILHHATQLPLVGSEVPKSWVDVRNALKERSATQAHIPFSDFAALCEETGIEEAEKISDLARFFHDLGIVLWYEDISALKNKVILQPEWATDAVYLIINDEQIQNQKGHFNYQDLERIWADPRHQDMCHELLEMMKEFRLCYQKRSRKKAFIIPSLLSPEPPTLQWNKSDNIQLQYEYSFMPKGIVNQLSAELHTYIQKDGHIWGQGVVLTDKSGLFKAKIEEDWFNRKIDIRTSGQDARAILRRITDTIENDIHQYFPGVDFKKFVPCFCSVCQTSQTPEFYDYDSLLKVLQRSPTFFCNIGGDSFDIQKALFNIGDGRSISDSPFEEKRRRKSNDSKQSKKAKKLFISYSTEDEAYLEGLKKQLAILDRKGELVTWDDTCIFAGENWSEQTEAALKEADMILLLVSSDFLANDQIDEIEVATALRLKEIGETCIIPIVIRPCMWKRSDFAKYSVLPSKGKPISKWDDRDEAWLSVVEGIAELL